MKEALGPVEDVARGLIGKERWDSNLKASDTKSLAALYPIAEKSLLATKSVARLRPAIQNLQKAPLCVGSCLMSCHVEGHLAKEHMERCMYVVSCFRDSSIEIQRF